MRQDIRTVYTAKELKEKFPDAFDRAWTDYRYAQTEIIWGNEIIESMKGLFEAAGLNLDDYEIDGICGHSSLKFSGMSDEARELSGKRAFAWIENNLLGECRIKFEPLAKHGRRRELAQYGSYYRPGMIEPCPFTGYCADDDFIDALIKDIKSGECLGDAFKGLADVAGKMRAAENDNQQSEEYFLDAAESNEYEYDENGKQI